MNTSEILDLAADKVQQFGWTTGNKGWPGDPDHAGQVCLEGGIMAALGLGLVGRGLSLSRPAGFTDCPAYQAVEEYLGVSHSGDLYAWNDQQGSAEHVVEVLRSAAAVVRAQEESLEGQPLHNIEKVHA